ncbi:MAG: NUDIX domain-containing protein [Patescibacteria group bacterium]
MTQKHKYARKQYAIIAVDVAVFCVEGDTLLVLLQETNKPELKNLWALPGALIGHDEGLEQAAHRVLHEKAHIENLCIDQLATFGDPDRDPFGRVVAIAHFAIVNQAKQQAHAQKEYKDLMWAPIHKLPRLAYDHKKIIQAGIHTLQSRLGHTNIAKDALPREFTLSDLQNIYEVIFDKKFDKRNFRKQIQSLGLVKPTGNKTSGDANRPAELYTFSSSRLSEVSEIK